MNAARYETRAAVALACVAANSVCEAREGRSRRDLGKQVGLSGRTLVAIEEASILPSTAQLKVLIEVLGPLPTEHFALAAQFGEIPWSEAITDAIQKGGPITAREIAESIAAAVAECSVTAVTWRLTRALDRLEGSGQFQKDAGARYSCAAPPGPNAAPSGLPARGKRVNLKWTEQRVPDLDAFFRADSSPGVHEVVLNLDHPIYASLQEALDTSNLQDAPVQLLRGRAEKSAQLLRLLLEAWVAFEESEKQGERRDKVREIRHVWGRSIRETLATMEKAD